MKKNLHTSDLKEKSRILIICVFYKRIPWDFNVMIFSKKVGFPFILKIESQFHLDQYHNSDIHSKTEDILGPGKDVVGKS